MMVGMMEMMRGITGVVRVRKVVNVIEKGRGEVFWDGGILLGVVREREGVRGWN